MLDDVDEFDSCPLEGRSTAHTTPIELPHHHARDPPLCPRLNYNSETHLPSLSKLETLFTHDHVRDILLSFGSMSTSSGPPGSLSVNLVCSRISERICGLVRVSLLLHEPSCIPVAEESR